jgi:hypothetical protein
VTRAEHVYYSLSADVPSLSKIFLKVRESWPIVWLSGPGEIEVIASLEEWRGDSCSEKERIFPKVDFPASLSAGGTGFKKTPKMHES